MTEPRIPSKTIAAIDLGTNNCRLLIATLVNNEIVELERFSRIVRLGEGMINNNNLSEAAMNRAIDALKICSRKLSMHHIDSYRYVTTQACRTANNAAEFIERIQREVYLNLEVISSEEEAKLAFMGCSSLISDLSKRVLLIDIGGGSTELVWGYFNSANDFNITDWISLPCGVMTLAEHFPQVDSNNYFDTMKSYIYKLLQDYPPLQRSFSYNINTDFQVICASGTITTLTAVYLDLERYSRSNIDGNLLSRQQIEDAITFINNMNYQQRCAHPCIGYDRADLMLPGCAILKAIYDFWGIKEMTVADRGVREGIIQSLANKEKYGKQSEKVQAFRAKTIVS